jgi:hypothetical protein
MLADSRSDPPGEKNRSGEGSIEDKGCKLSGSAGPKWKFWILILSLGFSWGGGTEIGIFHDLKYRKA